MNRKQHSEDRSRFEALDRLIPLLGIGIAAYLGARLAASRRNAEARSVEPKPWPAYPPAQLPLETPRRRKHSAFGVTKKVLLLVMLAAIIAVVFGAPKGSFATFNAEVANTNNTFKTGSLYLHETKSGTCTSESASSNSNLGTSGIHLGDACDILFSGVSNNNYQQFGLDMKNAGSLDGTGLQIAFGNTSNGFAQTGCVSSAVYSTIGALSATITSGDTVHDGTAGSKLITLSSPLTLSLYSGAQIRLNNGTSTQLFTTTAIVSVGSSTIPVTSVTATSTFPSGTTNVEYSPQFNGGGGNLCSDLRLEMVEVGSSAHYGDVTFNTTTDASTSSDANSTCVYGTPSGTGCSAGAQLNALSNYPTFTNGTINLRNLNTSLGSPWDGGSPRDPNTTNGLDAASHRFLVLILYLPNSVGNSDQNLQATFDVVWHMDQSGL
jgi:hypothetical protein